MMKKLIFFLITLFVSTMTISANNVFNPSVEETASINGVNPAAGCTFAGTIGGDDLAQLDMPYGNRMGSYSFLNYSRNIRFSSYNPKTRSLVLTAYERGTGKYIGKFVGKLTQISGGLFRYVGVFTNYKGGKVNFNLTQFYGD